MAFVVINRITMPELAGMDTDKIAAVMLQRAPLPSDLIVELVDPTAGVEAEPVPSQPQQPPLSPPRKSIKTLLKPNARRGKP